MTRERRNYMLKVFIDEKEVDSVRTHSMRIFLKHLRSLISRKGRWRCYLRVSYGKKQDHTVKWQSFYNDGWYEEIGELKNVWTAFTEQ